MKVITQNGKNVLTAHIFKAMSWKRVPSGFP